MEREDEKEIQRRKDNLILSHKIGGFHLSGDLVRKNPDAVANCLSLLKFIPHKVEHLFYTDQLLMVGLSEKFEEKEEGQAFPFYDVIVNKLEDGNITILVQNQLPMSDSRIRDLYIKKQ